MTGVALTFQVPPDEREALRAAVLARGAREHRHRRERVRLVLPLRARAGDVELALDEGLIELGGRVRSVHEITFESKQDLPADVVAAALPWVRRHGLWLDGVSWGERAVLLSRGRHHAEPSALVREIVAGCLDPVLRNASEVASGSHDPEHVHQLRVGLRRLRTVLRELVFLDAGLDPGWEEPITHTFRTLGRVRDQTLLDTETGRSLAEAGAPRLRPLADTASPVDPAGLVTAWPFQEALLAMVTFSMSPPEPAATAFDGDAIAAIGERLDQLQRKLRKNAKRFANLQAEEQHALRKRLKRLRYLAEVIAPAFRRKKVSATFASLKPAQDALGERNDVASALAHFQARTADDPRAWFAVGWFTARQAGSAAAAAKALRAAGRTKAFWRGKRR